MINSKDKNARKIMSVISLSFIYVAIYMLPYIKYVFYDEVQQGLAVTHEQLGFLLTIYAIVCMISYIPGGWVSDRYSVKKIIAYSTIGTGLLCFMLAVALNYTMAMVVWALLGISSCFAYWGASIKAIRMLGTPEEQGRLYGWYASLEGIISTVVAFGVMFIFNILPDPITGLKVVLIFYDLLNVGSAIFFWFVYDEKKVVGDTSTQNEERVHLRDIGKVLKLPQTWFQALMVLFAYAVSSGSSYMTPYITDVLGITGNVGTIVSIIRTYIIAAVICPIAGMITDNMNGSSKPLRNFGIIGAICLSSMAFLVSKDTPIIITVALILVSATLSYMNYAVMWTVSEEVKIPRKYAGTAIGLASIVGYLPESFMHTLFGMWLDKFGNGGYKYILIFLAVCFAATALTAIALRIYKNNTHVGDADIVL